MKSLSKGEVLKHNLGWGARMAPTHSRTCLEIKTLGGQKRGQGFMVYGFGFRVSD
jgi:hypothetical protein